MQLWCQVCDNYNDSQKEMLERVSLIFPHFNRKREEENSSILWALKC